MTAGHAKRQTKIMGIVNLTPDSFSDGGSYLQPQAAIRHAYRLIDEGADILDIGAESTRPDATAVSSEEEWVRLAPVLEELCYHSPVPISVDTYKSEIAARALDKGVQIINDIWGGTRDTDMLRIVAEAKCDYIWMHNRPLAAEYGFPTLLVETEKGIEECLHAGIEPHRLWIDPGIGFGKTYGQNLVVLRRLEEYCRAFDFPVLLGTSRKSVIGNTLGTPPGERLEGSLATAVWGVRAGVAALRVHDVSATVKASQMTEAIMCANE